MEQSSPTKNTGKNIGENIRNFAIIAHIDHGKSTLADRILEICRAVEPRDMRTQYLDTMELERERGITIKLQSVHLNYTDSKGRDFTLNLIDTPGHVDFGHEVSRSLAACEGAVVLVDAAQGIQAQTLAVCYHAIDKNVELVAALNKIDLPAADPDQRAMEIEKTLGVPAEEVLRVSALNGEGVVELLDVMVDKVPAPENQPLKTQPLRALVFDSHYDRYRGVVSSVRVVDGELKEGSQLLFMNSKTTYEALEVGYRTPTDKKVKSLPAGQVGYLIAGIKNLEDVPSGETITDAASPAAETLDSYEEAKPMVFCGIYPLDSDDFASLRDALGRLRLNDVSFSFNPDTSPVLGFGFLCGFLGPLHMEVIQQRLEREFDIPIVATAPSVEYTVILKSGEQMQVASPAAMPETGSIQTILEPMLLVSILGMKENLGALMETAQSRRGEMKKMEYISADRVELEYRLPLAEVIKDFFEVVKSRTSGYASIDYQPDGYEEADLVKVDILLQSEPVDAFSSVIHKDFAYQWGRKMTEKLKEEIPRQQFDVPIQAAIGSKIIARETVKAYRKDVTEKLYGGDVTRKRKLLEKQKAGKKKMKSIGRVEVPQEAFVAVLKLDN